MATPDKILFYCKTEPYYEFSNFYGTADDKKFQLLIDGKEWPSTEHFYQASKFMKPGATPDSLDYADLIRTASTPNKSFILAKQKIKGGYGAAWKHSKENHTLLNDLIKKYLAKGVKMRLDWDQVKDDVMLKALIAKFSQNTHLSKKIADTGDKLLIEHTSRDSYWGDGGNGTGLNMLGKLLMQVRSETPLKVPKKIPLKMKSKISLKLKSKIPFKSNVYDLQFCSTLKELSYFELQNIAKNFQLMLVVKK